MYSVPQSQQLTIFLCSLGAGFILGIFYDVMRALRLSFTTSKAAVIIFDIVYFLLCGVLSFLFILSLNKGEVRFYIIAGEVIGWVFYYLSFGLAVIKITDAFIVFFHKVRALLFKAISAPFRLIYRGFNSFLIKLSTLFRKTGKKSEKIRKKHLPKLRMYVYNLFGIISTGEKSRRKGGQSFGKHKSKKEKKANCSR